MGLKTYLGPSLATLLTSLPILRARSKEQDGVRRCETVVIVGGKHRLVSQPVGQTDDVVVHRLQVLLQDVEVIHVALEATVDIHTQLIDLRVHLECGSRSDPLSPEPQTPCPRPGSPDKALVNLETTCTTRLKAV